MRKKTLITFKVQNTLHGPEGILNDLLNENLFEVLNNDVEDVQGCVKNFFKKGKNKMSRGTGKRGGIDLFHGSEVLVTSPSKIA